jgi:hypothetical protein
MQMICNEWQNTERVGQLIAIQQEKSPVMRIPAGRERQSLLVQLAIREIKNHVPPRFQNAPPVLQRKPRIGKIFEEMGGINKIVVICVESAEKLRVAMLNVPHVACFDNRVAAITDVESLPCTVILKETLSQAAGPCLGRFTRLEWSAARREDSKPRFPE